ncbi:MAG TPA: response regulator [Verrucomicrobiae bacterium]|nr:response regulator [Verrucomicrobiae bacterium]
MISAENLKLYLAMKRKDERSTMEDALVLDGFDVRTFGTAEELWSAFEITPARMVISERLFPGSLNGLDLVANIRKFHLTPYVYSVILSPMGSLKQIKEALDVGVDDYLVRPHHRLQLRSRALVGTRWLNYIDSLFQNTTAK